MRLLHLLALLLTSLFFGTILSGCVAGKVTGTAGDGSRVIDQSSPTVVPSVTVSSNNVSAALP